MKKIITVFHSTSSKSYSSLNVHLNFPIGFKKVALITLKDIINNDEKIILNKAYQLSKNVVGPWLFNHGVTSSILSCRSTNYGDVFKYENNYYIIDITGFKKFTPEVK